MRLVTFDIAGKVSYGALIGDGIVDLGGKLGQKYPDVKALIAGDALAEAAAALKGATADFALTAVKLLPPLPNPDKILCVGVNYDDHRKETGRDKSEKPVIFTRFADTQVGHGQPLVRPRSSERFDYEGELAVVIGRPGRHIPESTALAHIAGYACYNDGSVRDWQRHTHQFTPGKNFPATGGFGPWLTTADEVPDPFALTLITRLNGQEVQKAGTDLMIFDLKQLIAYISGFTKLNPGDVIITGTPGGVGDKRNPPLYMKPGDVAEVEISGVGLLRNPVSAE